MAERKGGKIARAAAIGIAVLLSGCSARVGQGCNQANIESDPQSFKTSAEFNSFLGGAIIEGRISPNSGTKFIRVHTKGGCTPGELQVFKPGPEIVDDGQGNVYFNW